jgi:hypothetical protein
MMQRNNLTAEISRHVVHQDDLVDVITVRWNYAELASALKFPSQRMNISDHALCEIFPSLLVTDALMPIVMAFENQIDRMSFVLENDQIIAGVFDEQSKSLCFVCETREKASYGRYSYLDGVMVFLISPFLFALRHDRGRKVDLVELERQFALAIGEMVQERMERLFSVWLDCVAQEKSDVDTITIPMFTKPFHDNYDALIARFMV